MFGEVVKNINGLGGPLMEAVIKTKILLVEDSASDAAIIRHGLGVDDFIILEATTLAQALPLINEVDLLIVDLTLPDSFPETTISELTRKRRKPMLIITGTADPEVAYAAGRLGVLGGYLVKPVAKEQLLVSVAWALGLYRRLEDRFKMAKGILNGEYDEVS